MRDKTKHANDDDVDLIEWGQKLWRRRRFITFMTLVFIALGVTYSFMVPAKYGASTIFITKSGDTEKVPSGLGGLASLAGVNVNLSNNDSDIPVGLYSKLANSIPFLRKLVETPLKMSDGTLVTYEEYYDSVYQKSGLELMLQYTIGLPSYILNSKSSGGGQVEEVPWIRLNQKEKQNFDRISAQLGINVNQQEGYISLQFSMDKPALSAQMATASFNLLQQELIQYKIQKAQESYNFTEESFNKKRNEFFDIQESFADFKDRNKNITSATALNQIERLQSEYDLKFRLYSELASQLEQGKLDLNKERPAFFVIQPVSEPLLRTSPKRKNIAIISLLFGFILSVVITLIRPTLTNTWRKIRLPQES